MATAAQVNGATLLDSRVRLRLLTAEHREHQLTMNLYLSRGGGARDARVWCVTCARTLRVQGRTSRPDEEVVVCLG